MRLPVRPAPCCRATINGPVATGGKARLQAAVVTWRRPSLRWQGRWPQLLWPVEPLRAGGAVKIIIVSRPYVNAHRRPAATFMGGVIAISSSAALGATLKRFGFCNVFNNSSYFLGARYGVARAQSLSYRRLASSLGRRLVEHLQSLSCIMKAPKPRGGVVRSRNNVGVAHRE